MDGWAEDGVLTVNLLECAIPDLGGVAATLRVNAMQKISAITNIFSMSKQHRSYLDAEAGHGGSEAELMAGVLNVGRKTSAFLGRGRRSLSERD